MGVTLFQMFMENNIRLMKQENSHGPWSVVRCLEIVPTLYWASIIEFGIRADGFDRVLPQGSAALLRICFNSAAIKRTYRQPSIFNGPRTMDN